MKKFFGFILVVVVIGGVAFFFVKNKNSNTEMVPQSALDETTEQNTWDSVSNEISNGIEAVGKGIKSGLDKVKVDSKDDSTDEPGFFDKIGEIIKDGKESAEKVISSHETTTITGKLVVKGKGKNMTCFVKTGFLKKYRVKTITGTENSYTKLAGFKGKRIKVSGVLNTETKEITAASYKLAKEK